MKHALEFPERPIEVKNYCGNKYIGASGSHIDVESPYNGQKIGQLNASTADDVHRVVEVALKAQLEWKLIPIKERCNLLLNFRNLVLQNIDHLANYAAIESGKTFGEGKAGILKGIEVTDFAISLQNSDLGGALEVSRGVTCQYRREPLGVVAGIAPFNFPGMVPMWMYPIAIALGNAFILKPSEKVPLTSHFTADLFDRAGLPSGVFNIVHGTVETVNALIENPTVKAVAFVGSTPVAKAIYKNSAAQGKRCLALGGAKNHLILVPDADPNIAVQGIVDSFTGCAGQRCMAASLMVAVGDVESLLEKIVAAAEKVELGTNMGAIIDKKSYERILGILDRAEKEGAKFLLDGRKSTPPRGFEGGYWLGATIIEAQSPDMECAATEIFGPVMTIVRTKSLKEAIVLENKNPFGNATSIFTSDGGAADYVAQHSSNGMIGVNIGVPVPREPFSFGGTKESKFGAGDITGQGGVEFWTDRKKVTQKWSIHKDRNWMS